MHFVTLVCTVCLHAIFVVGDPGSFVTALVSTSYTSTAGCVLADNPRK